MGSSRTILCGLSVNIEPLGFDRVALLTGGGRQLGKDEEFLVLKFAEPLGLFTVLSPPLLGFGLNCVSGRGLLLNSRLEELCLLGMYGCFC